LPWHIDSKNSKCSGWVVVKDSDGSIAGCHKTKAGAQAQLAALYANVKGRPMVDEALEKRVVGLANMEIRHTGRATEAFTIRGYAAVYNETSHDLGGFKEQIAPGAFDDVLATSPDVHFVWDHDTRYVGARTKNNTLHLESDTTGLFIDAQVGNYSWAKDLRVALERGDINQGSFAFNVAEDGDEWAVQEDESVMRTIRNVSGLYDVTVTAQGAYPQTSLAAVRSLAAVTGRPPEPGVEEAALVAAKQGQGDEQDDELEVKRIAALAKKVAARKTTLEKLAVRLEKLK
jgi:HK97 family phage prohead protease